VRAVRKALDEEHPIIAALFRIRLLTAQRGSEVHGASCDEMDLTTGWWTIPGARSKNGLDHRVPLSPQALRILKELRRTAASLMVSAGVPRLVVSKILNHVETGVAAVYDRHSYDQEKRSALDFWGRRWEAILANKRDAKVLTFEARR
jgi:integrase